MTTLTRRSFLQSTLTAAAATRLTVVAQNSPRAAIPYVDGLCLGIPGASMDDIRASGMTAMIADVSAVSDLKTPDGSLRFTRTYEGCKKSIRAAGEKLRARQDVFVATKGSEIKPAFRAGRTAVFLQFQGCEPMGEDLNRLAEFYQDGLRVLQITHHNDNPFGGGCIEKNWTGLTKLGVAAVQQMNALGIIPDLSHASDPTSLDVLKTSRKPVIISHSACRALVNNARCASDEVIRGVAKSGGVMGIFAISFWLTNDPVPTLEAYLKQIRHVIKVGGIDSVGIANDQQIGGEPNMVRLKNDNAAGAKLNQRWWDQGRQQGILGFDQPLRHIVIPELNQIRRMFVIHEALEKDGFKAREIEKIMGGNWIRVLSASLK